MLTVALPPEPPEPPTFWASAAVAQPKAPKSAKILPMHLIAALPPSDPVNHNLERAQVLPRSFDFGLLRRALRDFMRDRCFGRLYPMRGTPQQGQKGPVGAVVGRRRGDIASQATLDWLDMTLRPDGG